MATALEHRRADFTFSLNEEGEIISIDGEDVLAFVKKEPPIASEFPRAIVERKTIKHLAGSLAERVPGQVVTIGQRDRWEVVTHQVDRVSGNLILQRNIS